MGHKDDNSGTDSDEEGNVRHDRFRSERFKEESRSSSKYRVREDSFGNHDRHSSRRHRASSPSKYSKSRSSTSSSSYRNETRRSNHERQDKSHHSKSNKSSKHEKKQSNTDKNKSVEKSESSKRSLSSILKNFDKNLESKRENLETQHVIGPALPPQIMEKCKEDKESVKNNPLREESVIGPALPPSFRTNLNRSGNEQSNVDSKPSEGDSIEKSPTECLENPAANSEGGIAEIVGPALPPHLKHSSSTHDLKNTSILKSLSTGVDADQNNESSTSNVNDDYSALPPEADKEEFGPVLPPTMKKDIVQGPTLSEGITADQLESLAQEESEDEDMVGPLPEGKMNLTQYQLDLRALHIKRKLDEEKLGTSKDIKKREEWMLELPPEKASNLGLGPRSFRMREAPDMSDRSSWTDTPADKLRKLDQALTGEAEPISSEEMKRTAFIKEREEAMDRMAQLSRDQDRPQSLLELHQKKIKKKKKKEEKEGKKKERRPFDRNIDLQVNRFDDAQKKAIFKKAQLLDTRFSTGESKYL